MLHNPMCARVAWAVVAAALKGAEALAPLALLGSTPWRLVDQGGDIKTYERELPGERLAEVKVTTVVRGDVETLCTAAFGDDGIDPREPGVTSRKVLAADAGLRIAYEQVTMPVISGRDYAVRSTRTALPNGTCQTHFEAANQYAPSKPEGYVRIEKLRGGFTFEPLAQGKVACTYTVFTDPGGALPALVLEGPQRKTAVQWMKLVLTRAAQASDGGR